MGQDDLDPVVGDAQAVRRVFEALPMFLVGLSGREKRVVAVNAAYRALAKREQLIGVPLLEAFPELAGQQLFEMIDRVFTTGVRQVARDWRVQLATGPTPGALQEFYSDFTASPWLEAGEVVGVTVIGVDTTEQVRERQRARYEVIEAEQRYERARNVITALQRQLLPSGLPVLPSVRVAGSYLLADTDTSAGGDWFDAIPLGGGRVALVVGDVVGHGVAASATMGQLRAVLQDRLDETGDILTAIRAADRMANRVPDARAATVCVAILDPDGTLTWCSAGHPPPLIAGADDARYLPASGCGPLGTGVDYAVSTDRLDAGDVLLLYSNGIIERPGREPAAATVELSQVAEDIVAGRGLDADDGSPVDRVCSHALELLLRQTGHTDDITLLAAQRLPAVPPPLDLRLLSDLDAIGPARRAVTEWLRAHGAGRQDVDALTHAVVELVTNAAEHSHPDTPDGSTTVRAELSDDGVARVTVADDGRWLRRDRPGSADFRSDHGLGLAMTSRFVDRWTSTRVPGTTAVVERRLSHPAWLLTADEISRGAARPVRAPDPVMLILDQPQAQASRVAVHGPLDATTVDHLTSELDRLTLGGTHDLTLDLTGVTHLTSVVVVLFHRLKAKVCLPGGHHVLTLVSHTTTDPDA